MPRAGSGQTALTRDPLESMLETWTDAWVGIRDRALLLFAFAGGGHRRSEIATAVLQSLVRSTMEVGY